MKTFLFPRVDLATAGWMSNIVNAAALLLKTLIIRERAESDIPLSLRKIGNTKELCMFWFQLNSSRFFSLEELIKQPKGHTKMN